MLACASRKSETRCCSYFNLKIKNSIIYSFIHLLIIHLFIAPRLNFALVTLTLLNYCAAGGIPVVDD